MQDNGALRFYVHTWCVRYNGTCLLLRTNASPRENRYYRNSYKAKITFFSIDRELITLQAAVFIVQLKRIVCPQFRFFR